MNKDKLHFLSPLFLKYQSEFEKNPRSRVFAPLAESYRKVGMTDKALEILSQGIRFNPSYVMGYLGLASCYFDMKQFGLAYSTLRPLVETNRDNLRLQKMFADICIAFEHKEEALETLKYLLFINPKDKEVAKLVSILESEIDEKYKPHHRPIIIPAENFSDENSGLNLFDVDKLSSTPKVDFDDWLNIDLSTNKKEKTSNENVETQKNEWVVQKNVPVLKEVPREEPTIDLKFNLEPEPFVTHTLVDLYCGQGHIEKAVEVLEKILVLNPNDSKTREKLNEIQALLGPVEEELVEPEIVEEEDDNSEMSLSNLLSLQDHSPKLVDLEELDNATEEDGRRNLMNILDETILSHDVIESEVEETSFNRNIEIEKKLNSFLLKIQERALDYQRRF